MNTRTGNSAQQNIFYYIDKFKMEIILLGLIIIASIITPTFLSLSNGMTILGGRSAMKGIIAFGMTFVIIAGEIDLSIGSTVGLAGIVSAQILNSMMSHGSSPVLAGICAIVITLLMGAALGAFNGFLMVTFRMPSFIVTLGMTNAIYGLAQIIAPYTITGLPEWYKWFGSGRLFQFGDVDPQIMRKLPPVPVLFLLVFFIITLVLLRRTRFGRAVYAVGGNSESARLSAINVKAVRISVMVLSQFCAAFAGIIMSSSVVSASFTFGDGWEMDVIASVIIGGASLSGGFGTAAGTMIGVIFLGVVNNIMTLLGVGTAMQYVVQGGLVVCAVLLNSIHLPKARHLTMNGL